MAVATREFGSADCTDVTKAALAVVGSGRRPPLRGATAVARVAFASLCVARIAVVTATVVVVVAAAVVDVVVVVIVVVRVVNVVMVRVVIFVVVRVVLVMVVVDDLHTPHIAGQCSLTRLT